MHKINLHLYIFRYLFTRKIKERCLFVNVSESSQKLLHGYKLNRFYKPIIYDSLSQYKNIDDYIEKLNIKVIILDNSRINHLPRKDIITLSNLKIRGIELYDAQHFYEILNRRISLVKLSSNEYHVDDILSLEIVPVHYALKRILDVLFSILLLPIAVPFILLGILLTSLTSKGNVFFVQKRIGKNSVPFNIYKLRTMEVNHNGHFTEKNDVRITKIGKFLRLTKIDELPQLFNILKGEMSIIGPRPERPQFVLEAISENAYFELRHLVKPGLTGWAQVHLPKATPKDNLKKLEYDLYYIKYNSYLLDFEILLRTIRIILSLKSN